MQPVAEFVKQGLGVVEAQKGGCASGEIVVVDDDRGYRAVQGFLVAVTARPGAGLLARPGEIVVQEDAEMIAGAVTHLPCPHIGVVDG